MVNLNRQIRATQARQGGFSSHVLPSPVGYQVSPAWSLGWLFEDYVYEDTFGTEKIQVTAISGDGTATAQSVLYSPGGEVYVLRFRKAYVVPVDSSTFLAVPVLWDRFGGAGDILWPTLSPFAGTAGPARKGFLMTASTVAEVNISESMASALAGWTDDHTDVTPDVAGTAFTVCVGNPSIFTGGGTVPAVIDDTSASGFSQYNVGFSINDTNASLFNQFKAETLPWTVSIGGTPVSKTTTGAAATGAAIQMGQLAGGDGYGDTFSALISLSDNINYRDSISAQFGMTIP